MPKVSIVVPVYKVEKYLDRCVQSLRNQTLQDIEIILVDDGSPDRCPEMCDEYARQDSRIHVIHKKNGGLSSARNAGIANAVGEYIGFVDSDDDVDETMYEQLLGVAEKTNVDYVMGDYIRFHADGSCYLVTKNIEGGLYSKDRIRKEIYPQLIMTEAVDYGPCLSVCLALYRKNFLDQYQLSFDEEVKWSEDNIFSAIAGYQCNSFYYYKGAGLYHYRENPGTITTSYRKGAWDVYCTMNRHLHAFFDQVSDYDFSRQLQLHLIYYACNCINQEVNHHKGNLEKRRILHSDELKEAFKNFPLPKVHWKLKVNLFLIKYRLEWLQEAVKWIAKGKGRK